MPDQVTADLPSRPEQPPADQGLFPLMKQWSGPLLSDPQISPGVLSNLAVSQDIAKDKPISADTIKGSAERKNIQQNLTNQDLAAVTNEIYGIESDFGRNPKTTPSRVGPAIGPMQITPDTWTRYAQPGEDINNPTDNKRVGDRVVADLWTKAGAYPNADKRTAVMIGYNAGDKAMDHYLKTGTVPTYLESPYLKALGMETGKNTEAGDLSSFQQSQAEAGRLIAQDQERLSKLLDSLGSGRGDAQERRKMLQDALNRSRSLQDQMMDLAKNPPTQKPTDLMSTFGSLAMLIGAIGGLKSRQPATAALNAAAGAIEGITANNHEEFDRNFKTWQMQSRLLSELTGIQSNDFRSILENERIDEAERHNLLEEKFQEFGMTESLTKLRLGQIEEAYKVPFELEKLKTDLDLKHAQIVETMAKTKEAMAKAENAPGTTAFGNTELGRMSRDVIQEEADRLGIPFAQLAADPTARLAARQKAQYQFSQIHPSPSQARAEEKRADAADAVDSTLNLIDATLGTGPDDPNSLITSRSTGIAGEASKIAQGVAGTFGVNLDTKAARFEQNANLVQAAIRNELVKSHYMSKGAVTALDEIVPGLELLDDPVSTRQRWEHLKQILQAERGRLRNAPGSTMTGTGTQEDPYVPRSIEEVDRVKKGEYFVHPSDPDHIRQM